MRLVDLDKVKWPDKKDESHGNGNDCKCSAWSENECGCAADWTNYKLINKYIDACRAAVKKVKTAKIDIKKLEEIFGIPDMENSPYRALEISIKIEREKIKKIVDAFKSGELIK